jgi:hypothetical protein
VSHPLINDLTKLTLEELTTKCTELQKRLGQAYRLGYSEAVPQLNMLLEDYRYEFDRRSQKALEETLKNNPDFKSIIDIN